MLVIPAIDLMGGACVRLIKGKKGTQTVYSRHPAAVAKLWAEMGAPRLHVVDLDAAFQGYSSPENREALKAIVMAVDVPVQFGGGIRSMGDAREVLRLGVDRVIVGTVALQQPGLLAAMVGEFGDRLAVSIDSSGTRVVVCGWTKEVARAPGEIAREMAALGVRTLIHTGTSRDGTLQGPDEEGLKAVLEAGIPVIAAGGIGNIEHLRKLKQLEPLGLAGVVLGKALYSGAIDLREALSAVGEE